MGHSLRYPLVVQSLIISNIVSVGLFGVRVLATDNTRYYFLFWNLLLAWIPALIVWFFVKRTESKGWKGYIPLLLTLLWLGFLPNSFYLISDLIHLQSTGEVGILYDAVLFMSCIFNGLVAGYISMVWMHALLIKKIGQKLANIVITFALASSSFAIYLGRNLRWNTWDVLTNPIAILFDITERIINPLSHPRMFVTTLSFFGLLASMYLVIWSLTRSFAKPILKK